MTRMKVLAVLLAGALGSTSCAVLGVSGGCDGTEVIGNFEQVGDLVEAANVQSSDVTIGTISDIELDEAEWVARVTMCLDADEQIPADLEAVVRTTSLLGEKFIDLRPLTESPPYLQDGDIIGIENTSKATELEDVFARLATILGTGNLEELNRFTAAQARILGEHSGELREVLARLHRFTDVLVGRKGDIAASIESLDDVARTALNSQAVLTRFLDSFDDASAVLANQKEGLQQLLVSLDRFSEVSIRLLEATDQGLTNQFASLRPVLRTVLANSDNVAKILRTFDRFSDWFPETMPGDYLQLDVCQALETFTAGKTCEQSDRRDDESAAGATPADEEEEEAEESSGDLETILRGPLGGEV